MKCIYVHRMFIMFIRIYESENTWNTWRLSWFRYKTFIYLFEFKVFRYEERETQFLTMLTVHTLSALNSLTQPTRGHPVDPWSGLTQIKNWLASSQSKSQLTAFFKSPNPQPIASGHDVIHIPNPISYLGFLLWHLWLSHPPSSSVNTCTQCVHLANPCTKPKGSQPN